MQACSHCIRNSEDSTEKTLCFLPKVILAKRKEKAEATTKSFLLLDLFRRPRLRWKTVLVCWCFIANAVVYTTISYNTGNLPG